MTSSNTNSINIEEPNQNKGFVAGTLVHTDKGLVPIEQVQVGDMVLSKHENDFGKTTYNRVIRKIITPDQFVWAMQIGGSFSIAGSLDYDFQKEEFLFVGVYQKLWSCEKDTHWSNSTMYYSIDKTKNKWITVYEYECGNALMDANNQFADTMECRRLYDTIKPQKVFYMVYPDSDEGIFLDVNAYQNQSLPVPEYIENRRTMAEPNWDENEEPIPDEYTATTYTLEVEEYNTYFVGELGIWVKT